MSRLLNGILILLMLAGITLMLYPTISDYSNRIHQTEAVAVYAKTVKQVDEKAIQDAFEKAQDYNERLYQAADKLQFSIDHQEEYESLLNFQNSGVMGYVDIPQINTTLPIYHGTRESVLQVAAGHLDWTSLPVGGEGTHAVLSGHRGLPSAKLFTNLDQLQIGDVFTVNVNNQTLHYEVDQITVVLPEEAQEVLPEAGKDYCTLITCTPYGVNTHRLLVRGSRIFPIQPVREIETDIEEISPAWLAGGIGCVWLFGLMTAVFIKRGRKRRADRQHAVTEENSYA